LGKGIPKGIDDEKIYRRSRFGLRVFINPAFAASTGAPVKCRVVEINPVTNYPTCIGPVGAAVEPLPKGKPCASKPLTGAWSMSNRCDEQSPAPPATN
jgi:hypothetical protein